MYSLFICIFILLCYATTVADLFSTFLFVSACNLVDIVFCANSQLNLLAI